MKSFVTVEKNQVRLTKFKDHHLTPEYVSWLNDKKLMRYSEQRFHLHTLASCSEYIASIDRANELFLAIEVFVESEWAHVGNLGVRFDWPNSIADMTIVVGSREARGSDIAFVAWNLAAYAALYKYNSRLVVAGTMSANQSMINLLRRSGMSLTVAIPDRFQLGTRLRADLVFGWGNKEVFNSPDFVQIFQED